ncbi:hypothetical protein KF7HA_00989 [Lactococcus lactis]|uniref:hypothetical protein n=1 Tax=Lactococcus lactis TaxID=1358 RepID=UPI000B08811F|nr:hypothetical protein [Lactococcus lactis]MDU0402686.1 hypothetical protein [Lactococcus lactis]
MKTKLIKKWYLLVLFFIWIGTMFLPSTVNQEKLDTVFYISKSREDFFVCILYFKESLLWEVLCFC